LFFNPNDHQTTGIRLTHQLSPWLGDYGAITMLPTSDQKVDFSLTRASGYLKEKAIFSPCLLRCGFLRYQSEINLVPTMHGANGTIKYSNTTPQKRLFIDCQKGISQISIDPQNGIITGYVSNHILPHVLPKNFKEFFVMRFNAPISTNNTVAEILGEQQTTGDFYKGENLKLSLCFDTKNTEISYSFATSYISLEQAELNLKTEIGKKSQEDVLKQAEDIWNKKLSKIEIQTDDEAQKRTFYTCLYRTYLFPHTFHEIDKNGKKIHYSPANGEVLEGALYTDMGFWDVYRTSMPLLTILEPEFFADICKGLVNFYKESGWLPRFSDPGPISCMPGTAIDMVFADAVKKSVITDKNLISLMLEGMLKHANEPCEDPKLGGRDGILDYKKLGYVPLEYKESVNKTLDYSYGDFCISVIAEALGNIELAKEYKKRALNYKNIFNSETNLLKAKDNKGNARADWSQFEWSFDYTEGSAWQNSFSVFHDMAGHAELMGGAGQMIKMIDKLFALPPIFEVGYRGKEIHEMTEMASVDFGQCALSNQPSFHIPYIYSYMGAPDNTCYQVRRAVKELFNPTENGFPGDEDTGSMSAWYIFSTLGFYPVTPATGEYVLASPSIKGAVIHTGYGTDFTIKTKDFNQNNLYAKSVSLKGKELNQTFINHEDIKKGETLTFTLSKEKTNKKYKNTPYSLSKFK
jgi:predicted alpha-1,2-mannosidase